MLRDAGTQLAPPNTAESIASELRSALLEVAPDVLLLVDPDGVVRYANGRTRDLFQYEPSELQDRPFELLIADSTRERFAGLWAQFSSKRQAYRLGEGGPLQARPKRGDDFAVELGLTPITFEGRNFAGVAVRDVTSKRALENQLTGLQKVEALGKLAGAVAHDFNNILTAIGSFADLAYHAARSGSSVRANLEEVLAAAEQARLLTKKLLDFAKRRPVEPVIVDLNAVVRATERMVDVLMNQDVHVVRLLSPRVGLVRVDPGGIEQVLINLCVNACDAMPNGGTLTLETGLAQLSAEGAVPLGPNVTPGTYAVLRVLDTGTGMSDEVRRQVFEPFFSTKPPGSGSGLGLATCYGLVAQAGGFMSLRSQLGEGTCVEVYLPQAPLMATTRTARTILVVEPDPTVRLIATRELGQAGFNPIAAKGWTEALDAVRSLSGNLDLLLIDVGIPATDGIELATRIRRLCPTVKTLFVSQFERQALTLKGTIIEEHEFLQKPFGIAELLGKLASLLSD